MRTTRFLFVVLAAFALAAPLACGGGTQSKSKTAAIKPGNLPAGATWDGVYFNPIWGYLHIVTEGNGFKGKWQRTDKSAWGEMHGTITGDVIRFDFAEHKVGMVGPSATTKGKGYFRYVRPEGENLDDRLKGEWGFDDAEVGGGEWDGIKQRNQKPDLSSIQGEAESGVGDWK